MALKDLLPDWPREVSVLVAAAEAGLADALSYNVAHGMDPSTARAAAVKSFAKRTGLRPAECSWAVEELAAVLDLDSAGIRTAR
jgi:hypothetical protein